MNSAQESKNELEAAIRYAENAISSAKQTIESMEFRQEMAKKQHSEQTGSKSSDAYREAELEAQVAELEERNDELNIQIVEQTNREATLEREVAQLKSEGALLAERIDEMRDAAFADANTIKHLKDKVQGQYDDIKQLERELTVKTANANAWKKEYDKLKQRFYASGDAPTMPVIPKAVAIAIFREGMQHGVESACTELEKSEIRIEESEYVGDFHVTFERRIDLEDELDLDWMRDKVGDYSEEFVIDALGTLCADKEFECRIHGVDDEGKDSPSA